MSKIKVNRLENTSTANGGINIDTSGHVQVDGLQLPTAGALSNRNLVMNGAMAVSQKPTKTGLTNGDSNTYIVDRFGFMESGSPSYQFTYSQDTDVPANQGFASSLKWLCTTADVTTSTNERLRIRQGFEGQNLQCIKKGTPNAETLTLSFWVKTNLSGDISVAMEDANNTRIISKNAVIAAGEVNTWVYKTIEFPGDTTGTLNNNNGASIYLEWYVRAGTNYTSGSQATAWSAATTDIKASSNNIDLGGAVNNYINLTGVQLEVGSKATPFEHESYGQTLAKCQRYYQSYVYAGGGIIGTGLCWNTTNAVFSFYFRTEMRASPTITLPDAGSAAGQIAFLASNGNFPAAIGTHTASAISTINFALTGSNYTGLAGPGSTSWLYQGATSGTTIQASAEL